MSNRLGLRLQDPGQQSTLSEVLRTEAHGRLHCSESATKGAGIGSLFFITLPEALRGNIVHARTSASTMPMQMAAMRLPARITTLPSDM